MALPNLSEADRKKALEKAAQARQARAELRQKIKAGEMSFADVMAKSDDRAAKCSKSGLDFRATYPLDYEEYEAANAEYNANEKTLAELRARRAEELAAEETVMDFQNIEQ